MGVVVKCIVNERCLANNDVLNSVVTVVVNVIHQSFNLREGERDWQERKGLL